MKEWIKNMKSFYVQDHSWSNDLTQYIFNQALKDVSKLIAEIEKLEKENKSLDVLKPFI